jgi:hypothetical protein
MEKVIPELKPKLTPEQIQGKKWNEVMQYYWPEISDEEAAFILDNQTCFPFSDKITHDQLYELYRKKQTEKKL